MTKGTLQENIDTMDDAELSRSEAATEVFTGIPIKIAGISFSCQLDFWNIINSAFRQDDCEK